jgi:hypothetical protein
MEQRRLRHERVTMTNRLVTCIIETRSLQILLTQIDQEISYYLSQKEEYSTRLGNFLRESADRFSGEDWLKQLSLETLKKGNGKPGKKRGRKTREPDDWIQFKGMHISSNVRGEAEIMFEVIQEINSKLDKLKEAKTALEEIKSIGLGNEVKYVCLLKDGVATKIVIKPLGEDLDEKFAFNRGFTVIQAVPT